jgi:hypothetical protein
MYPPVKTATADPSTPSSNALHPFAGYITFDGTSGENCLAKRDRSNTPLQALTLLNDEMFIELAQAAGELVHQKKEDPVESLFRRFLTRMPKAEERKALQGYFDQQVERLQAGELKAGTLLATPRQILSGQAKFCLPGPL